MNQREQFRNFHWATHTAHSYRIHQIFSCSICGIKWDSGLQIHLISARRRHRVGLTSIINTGWFRWKIQLQPRVGLDVLMGLFGNRLEKKKRQDRLIGSWRNKVKKSWDNGISQSRAAEDQIIVSRGNSSVLFFKQHTLIFTAWYLGIKVTLILTEEDFTKCTATFHRGLKKLFMMCSYFTAGPSITNNNVSWHKYTLVHFKRFAAILSPESFMHNVGTTATLA